MICTYKYLHENVFLAKNGEFFKAQECKNNKLKAAVFPSSSKISAPHV